jgi:hypothetical protein
MKNLSQGKKNLSQVKKNLSLEKPQSQKNLSQNCETHLLSTGFPFGQELVL